MIDKYLKQLISSAKKIGRKKSSTKFRNTSPQLATSDPQIGGHQPAFRRKASSTSKAAQNVANVAKKTRHVTATKRSFRRTAARHTCSPAKSTHNKEFSGKKLRRFKELNGLSQLVSGLHRVFEKIRSQNAERNHAQEQLIENVTGKLQRTFDELHKEFDERERILEKKLQRSKLEQAHEMRRVKWLSVPVGVIAIAGLIYIFYVVHVMENAMSSMSEDIHDMGKNMSAMSTDTRNMSNNITEMNENIAHMDKSMGNINHNVSQMNRNMGVMTNNVTYMNRNVGTMTQTMRPIGEAAQTTEPMMTMMRSFLPF